MKRLLAKGTKTPDAPQSPETLIGHTLAVVEAARVLLGRIGLDSLAAVGLSDASLGRLMQIVLLAAYVHDFGKASEHFQEMLRQLRRLQLFRHEAVSLWLLWHPGTPLGHWLRSAAASELDFKLALMAAAGHHRKFPSNAIHEEGAGSELRVLTSHPDFAELLARGQSLFNLGAPPTPADQIMVGGSFGEASKDLSSRFPTELDDLELGKDDRALLGIAKALLVNADVVGSALPRTSQSLSWVEDLLQIVPSGLEHLIETKLDGNAMRPFQEAVARSDAPVTLVTAGCGSGKTLAAWAWGHRRSGRQVWLCYPTTGTTTEGFRDYIAGADIHGFIEHGRSRVDVEIFGLREGLGDGDIQRDAERLRAIRQWGADAVTCTVDTVLGLLQFQRKGMYAWPSLSRAAVIFDEIHAYDEELFGLLLAWLERFPGIPTLLMTASLGRSRLEGVRKAVGRRGASLREISGPPELETLKRYQRLSEDPNTALQAAAASGLKVLHVSNTVARCVAASQRLAGGMVYHSRFRYIDRVRRHRALIDAFKAPGGTVAFTTQVAEMSLDLSADLLVTELAPISALIQRLGRLNRRAKPGDGRGCMPFVVVEPGRAEPYSRAELDEARRWLDTLGTGELSQRDLVDAWRESEVAIPKPTQPRLFGDGYATEPREIRQSSPGITVVLEGDRQAIRSGELDILEAALPMGPPPRGVDLHRYPLVEYHPAIPQQVLSYDPHSGGQWL